MLRFRNLKELRKSISPDVEILDDGEPSELAKEVKKLTDRSRRTVLEDVFLRQWELYGGPPLVREYRFHPTRKWRFDFAHPASKTAFEIMGGLYNPNSGHRSREGVSRDYEKANEAQRLGWDVYAVTSQDIKGSEAIGKLVKLVLGRPIVEEDKSDHD